jgi:hypothetical protein
MADKTYKSSLFKRIIDLGLVREAEVNDLVRIWRVGTGDEKAITLENFVKTVDTDLGSGGLTLTEIVDIIAVELDTFAFIDLTDTPANYTGQGGKSVLVKEDETGLEFVIPIPSTQTKEIFTYSTSSTFNLSNPEVIPLFVTLNGQVLQEGGLLDYTISGSQLTVTAPLRSGDEISILYFVLIPLLNTNKRNIDGGAPDSIYLPIQNVDGGTP